MFSKTDIAAKLQARLSPESLLRVDEALARRTTMRVGGPADVYVEPANEADLAETLSYCAQASVPCTLLGRGSNLLVKDGGVRGVVICLSQPYFTRLELVEGQLHCGAGVKLKQLAVEARRHGIAGLEFVEGIPGTLGGALRMNAGAMGSCLFDQVVSLRFMDSKGQAYTRVRAEIAVHYRGCPLLREHIALDAVLKGDSAPAAIISERMSSFSEKRWKSQPAAPSAGCIFKNPATIPAGKLIDEVGLKGLRVGGAVVSDVHGNFIINEGNATAQDILNLILLIQQRVKADRGIDLETEVQIIGE